MKISKSDYKEFQKFKQQKSVFDVENLEEDIDFPIRNVVAMCALAGMHPMFSCCGFDYHGQPTYKSHQYGEPYVMFKRDQEMSLLFSFQTKLGFGWELQDRQSHVLLNLKMPMNPYWRDPHSPHFSEEMVIEINRLERNLYPLLEPYFKDWVTLHDTNATNHHATLKSRNYQLVIIRIHPPESSNIFHVFSILSIPLPRLYNHRLLSKLS